MKKLLLLSIVAFSTSCVGVKVNSAHDPSADFDKHQTFQLMDAADSQYQGPKYAFNAERFRTIKEAIQTELELKGLVNDAASPDLLVGFHVIVEEKQTTLIKDSEMFNPYSQPINYWDGYEMYYNQENYQFLKGSLVIDIIDVKAGKAIWQGTAQRYMENIPQIDEEDVRKGIRKALKAYPPNN